VVFLLRNVTYGGIEVLYDLDRRETRLVKKRYETWIEDGQKFGRWDYVPADRSESDAVLSERKHESPNGASGAAD
jgi:hypothetical protein